jgi:GWxTD domain-containing protein
MPLRFRRRLFASILPLALSLAFDRPVTAQSSSLAGLFQKGKTEFKLAAYRQSLETFNALEVASREPGQEEQRTKLAPVIAFYRGANLAVLGDRKAAIAEFAAYLAAFPQADIDRSAFPKQVGEAFDAARRQASGESSAARGGPARDTGIAAAYANFRSDPRDSFSLQEAWAAGPARYLLTKSERAALDRISDPAERAEFVNGLWQKRDPDLLTPENEFRIEFEKRIQFADTHFSIGEIKGSQTDRGLVFALMGPPTYIVRTPLRSDEDPLQVRRAEPIRQNVLPAPGRRSSNSSVTYVEQPPLTSQTIQGMRETWHYGPQQLPRSVPFHELDFEFITKEGYGKDVLQRDQVVLLALDAAARGEAKRSAK